MNEECENSSNHGFEPWVLEEFCDGREHCFVTGNRTLICPTCDTSAKKLRDDLDSFASLMVDERFRHLEEKIGRLIDVVGNLLRILCPEDVPVNSLEDEV